MVLVHDTSSHHGLQLYQVSLKNLERFSSYRADTICDGQTVGQTYRRTDRRTGKNNMSPDPVGWRHNNNNNNRLYFWRVTHLAKYKLIFHEALHYLHYTIIQNVKKKKLLPCSGKYCSGCHSIASLSTGS